MSLTTLLLILKTGKRGYDPSNLQFLWSPNRRKTWWIAPDYHISTIWVKSVPFKVHIVLAVLDPLKEKINEGLGGVLLFLLNNYGLI